MTWSTGRNQRAVLIIVMLAIALVYWFGYRASQIRRNCSDEAELNPLVIAGSSDEQRESDSNILYKECLERAGVK